MNQFYIVACVTALLLPVPENTVAAQGNYPKIVGTFYGEVYNGSDLDPAVTTFILQPSGRIIGEYSVDEENGKYHGSISNIIFNAERTVSFEWTDKFGEGYAIVEFSSDFNRFSGHWSDRENENANPWYGVRD